MKVSRKEDAMSDNDRLSIVARIWFMITCALVAGLAGAISGVLQNPAPLTFADVRMVGFFSLPLFMTSTIALMVKFRHRRFLAIFGFRPSRFFWYPWLFASQQVKARAIQEGVNETLRTLSLAMHEAFERRNKLVKINDFVRNFLRQFFVYFNVRQFNNR